MLRSARFDHNKIFGHNDLMSGFCTAPENIVYWAFSRKKKCSLQHFGYCSSRCVDVSCFFDEFCSINTYGHMLEHRYKPVKTNQKLQVLKSLRGLSFQKDAAIATTHTSRWKKTQTGSLWTKWRSRTRMNGGEQQMDARMRDKGDLQSIYGLGEQQPTHVDEHVQKTVWLHAENGAQGRRRGIFPLWAACC